VTFKNIYKKYNALSINNLVKNEGKNTTYSGIAFLTNTNYNIDISFKKT